MIANVLCIIGGCSAALMPEGGRSLTRLGGACKGVVPASRDTKVGYTSKLVLVLALFIWLGQPCVQSWQHACLCFWGDFL